MLRTQAGAAIRRGADLAAAVAGLGYLDWKGLIGVSQAASESSAPNGFRRVYRAVCEAEYQDALQSGEFRPGPPNSYQFGKCFSDTLESARAHGEGLFPDGEFRLLEADVPENAPSMHRHPNIDQRGPATYLDLDDLKGVVPRPVHSKQG